MYKTGDKFIIEIGEKYETAALYISQIGEKSLDTPHDLYRIKGFNSLVFDKNGLDKLEKYENGEEDAYQRGLDDAWECAKYILRLGSTKQEDIFHCHGDIEILKQFSPSVAIEKIKMYEEQEEQKKDEVKVGDRVRTIKDIDKNGVDVFPIGTIGVVSSIDYNCSLPYIISVDDDYWKYSRDMFEVIEDDGIIVGDEIVYGDTHAVVTYAGATSWNGFAINDSDKALKGHGYTCMGYDGWKKTGRTFPQIADVLNQMQEEYDE